MNQEKSTQELLFQVIKQRLPSNLSFVHDISDLLGISYDSAYRRIRGEKELSMEEIKTKRFQEVIDRFGFKKTLFVIDQPRPALEKSSRNIRDVKMVRSEGVNVYDLLRCDHVVFLEPSVHKIEGALIS